MSTLVFYTLLTTPKTFFNVIASFDLMEDWEKKGKQTFRFAYAISNVLFNINYSCNFYVYCLANRYTSGLSIFQVIVNPFTVKLKQPSRN